MRNKLYWLVYLIVIVFLTLIQTSFFPQFIVFEIRPDILLLFVVSSGLLLGYREGAYIGALSGLTAGVISQNIWGLYILIYSLAGFTSGLVSEKVEPDNFIIPAVTGTISSACYALILVLMGHWLEIFSPSSVEILKALTFISWNAAFSIPIFIFTKYFLTGSDTEKMEKSPGIRSEYIIS
jgi:rod shape-determining protein MreD